MFSLSRYKGKRKAAGDRSRRFHVRIFYTTNLYLPTEGLDPEERVHFRNLLCEFARDRIVILSTHILSDVESCCERIGVLNHGRLIWSGRTEELRTPTLEEGYLRLLGQTEEAKKIENKESFS